MKISVTGATGFLGSRVVQTLHADGHQVHVLGRRRSAQLPESIAFSLWDAASEPLPDSLSGADVVIHLAGEPVAQRWTAEVKARIRDSRVEGTRLLVNALRALPQRPAVLVCASAIGIYGSRGQEILTETSRPGRGYLTEVVRDWESAAQGAESLSMRVARLRFGLVLGMGGALAKMLTPFRFGLGGRVGSGRQWMSWIHVEDAVRLILFTIENRALQGAINATAPNPVTNFVFTRKLARALHRPAAFPVPKFALKLLFGEMAEVMLSSQRVLPRVAEASGFRFRYPELGPALADLLSPEGQILEAK